MDKIKVQAEGREGVWLPEKDSLVDFLMEYKHDLIHNYIPCGVMLGADWRKESVIDEVNNADRLAILTGDSLRNNLNHALSVIKDNKLHMFDIGIITEDNLETIPTPEKGV